MIDKQILDNIEYCKAIMTLENDNPKKRELLSIQNGYKLGELDDVPVFYDPLFMRKCDEVMAMACFNGDIIVDEKFLKMSYNGKLFNLYHELGHIKLNHKEIYPDIEHYKNERKKFSKQNMVISIELEADEYCYDKMSYDSFMSGFTELKVVATITRRNIKEIDLRIKHFKEKEQSNNK